jgi:hypothetical protein
MDITREQAVILRDGVRKRIGYFHAVKMRMYQVGVDHKTEELYRLFDVVEEAMVRLATHLHDRTISPRGPHLGGPMTPVE